MYILATQFLNGTFTLGFAVLGIEAETFAEATQKVKNLPAYKLAINVKEDDKILSFNTPSSGEVKPFSYMKNEKLDVV